MLHLIRKILIIVIMLGFQVVIIHLRSDATWIRKFSGVTELLDLCSCIPWPIK